MVCRQRREKVVEDENVGGIDGRAHYVSVVALTCGVDVPTLKDHENIEEKKKESKTGREKVYLQCICVVYRKE